MTQSPDIPTLATALKGRIIPWSKTNLAIVSEFYQEGQWHAGDDSLYWYLGPAYAGLAATLFRYDTTLTKYRDIAIETVEASFLYNQNTPVVAAPVYQYAPTPNFPTTKFAGLNLDASSHTIACFDGGPWGTPDTVGSDENGTIEVGATICWIAEMLLEVSALDKSVALRWLRNLKYAADWLIDFNGNLIWFTNGNYAAHLCLFMGHLAKLCRILGDEVGYARYSQAYELAFQTMTYPFGNNPPANAQWAGYGYVIDTVGVGGSLLQVGGTVSDGSSEIGHLVEVASHIANPTATWDGVYGQLAADILATLYVVNRDWRIGFLLNAEWNKLDAITDYTTYLITTTGGSRNPGVSLRGWTGGYQNVIALLAHRAYNRTHVTNAICLGAWDNQIAINLTANGQNEINLSTSFHARLQRISVATSLRAAYLSDKKL